MKQGDGTRVTPRAWATRAARFFVAVFSILLIPGPATADAGPVQDAEARIKRALAVPPLNQIEIYDPTGWISEHGSLRSDSRDAAFAARIKALKEAWTKQGAAIGAEVSVTSKQIESLALRWRTDREKHKARVEARDAPLRKDYKKLRARMRDIAARYAHLRKKDNTTAGGSDAERTRLKAEHERLDQKRKAVRAARQKLEAESRQAWTARARPMQKKNSELRERKKALYKKMASGDLLVSTKGEPRKTFLKYHRAGDKKPVTVALPTLDGTRDHVIEPVEGPRGISSAAFVHAVGFVGWRSPKGANSPANWRRFKGRRRPSVEGMAEAYGWKRVVRLKTVDLTTRGVEGLSPGAYLYALEVTREGKIHPASCYGFLLRGEGTEARHYAASKAVAGIARGGDFNRYLTAIAGLDGKVRSKAKLTAWTIDGKGFHKDMVEIENAVEMKRAPFSRVPDFASLHGNRFAQPLGAYTVTRPSKLERSNGHKGVRAYFSRSEFGRRSSQRPRIRRFDVTSRSTGAGKEIFNAYSHVREEPLEELVLKGAKHYDNITNLRFLSKQKQQRWSYAKDLLDFWEPHFEWSPGDARWTLRFKGLLKGAKALLKPNPLDLSMMLLNEGRKHQERWVKKRTRLGEMIDRGGQLIYAERLINMDRTWGFLRMLYFVQANPRNGEARLVILHFHMCAARVKPKPAPSVR